MPNDHDRDDDRDRRRHGGAREPLREELKLLSSDILTVWRGVNVVASPDLNPPTPFGVRPSGGTMILGLTVAEDDGLSVVPTDLTSLKGKTVDVRGAVSGQWIYQAVIRNIY